MSTESTEQSGEEILSLRGGRHRHGSQRGNTAKMLISIPHLVAYHSAQGYSAGDILTTGTISGVAAVQPNPFEFYLQPGDTIEAEIEGVGVLRNHVVPWAAAHSTPPYSTDLYSSTS